MGVVIVIVVIVIVVVTGVKQSQLLALALGLGCSLTKLQNAANCVNFHKNFVPDPKILWEFVPRFSCFFRNFRCKQIIIILIIFNLLSNHIWQVFPSHQINLLQVVFLVILEP